MRRELSQGRLPAPQTVFFGAPYEIKLAFAGTQSIPLGDKQVDADRVTASVKGAAAEVSFEVFFLKDAARTPVSGARSVVHGHHVLNGACKIVREPLPADLWQLRSPSFLRFRLPAAESRIIRPRYWTNCASWHDVEVFSAKPSSFDPAAFDVILYQVGNNGYHDFCYEMALQHPGVVVVHEANLHHLIAEITIKRGDWDAYMRVLGEEGGPEALRYAERVRALEIPPDYEGVPMLRGLLARSKGAIVHSGCVEAELRSAGFSGPVARIPHGAWIPETSRLNYRGKLGVDELTPLIGIFGFLKPYKRIAESLRAFRRLLRVSPEAKMILVGEPHPELQLPSLIQSLGLQPNVRVLGFQPIEEFVGYLAACDIVLNLRYPTVGENSGTLMRALGLGEGGDRFRSRFLQRIAG